MKALLTTLMLTIAVCAFGANPSFEAFRGTNEVVIKTNVAGNRIIVGPTTPISQIASNAAQNVAVWTNDGQFITLKGTKVTNGAPFAIRRDGSYFYGSNVWQEAPFPPNFANAFPIYAVSMSASNEPVNMFFYGAVIDSEGYNFYTDFEFLLHNDKDSPTLQLDMFTAATNNHRTEINFDSSVDGPWAIRLVTQDGQPFKLDQSGSVLIQRGDSTADSLSIYDWTTGSTNLVVTSNGTLNAYTPIRPIKTTVSRLAAIGPEHALTNSAYSDTDISNLQGATNSFVKIQNGTANNLISTNTTEIGNTYYGTGNGSFVNSNNFTTTNLNIKPTNSVAGSGLTIGPAGNVGINTNNPTTALHVLGTTRLSAGAESTSGGTIIPATFSLAMAASAGSTLIFNNADTTHFVKMQNSAGTAFTAFLNNCTSFGESAANTAANPAIGGTNGNLAVFGGNGTYAGGATNSLWIMGGGIIQDFSLVAPVAPTRQGAAYWNDGTNVCVVLRNSAGTITTNKLSMASWP